jgi:small redox-active disulfide protein 2
MKTITVYGPGCARCKQTEDVVRKAIAASGVEAEVVKVTEYQEIAKAGVLATPAVAVDGQLKIAGKVPSVADVQKLLS